MKIQVEYTYLGTPKRRTLVELVGDKVEGYYADGYLESVASETTQLKEMIARILEISVARHLISIKELE